MNEIRVTGYVSTLKKLMTFKEENHQLRVQPLQSGNLTSKQLPWLSASERQLEERFQAYI